MQESAFIFLLIVSMFFVVLFLIFVLAVLPLWSFAECVSRPKRPKAHKIIGSIFIAVLWPFSPLVYAVGFSRAFMLRFSAAASVVLIISGGTLLAVRWDDTRPLYQELSYLASGVLGTVDGAKGVFDDTFLIVEPEGAAEKPVLEREVIAQKDTIQETIVLLRDAAMTKAPFAEIPSVENVNSSEIVRSHYSGGELRSEHTFRRGLLDGPSRTYYRSGSIMYHRRYEDGNLSSIKKFAEDGTLEFDTDYQS